MLVAERTRIVNRLKAAMVRLGVRGFKPHLRSAPAKLESLRTPEGVSIPPNTLAELRRDMARLLVLREQVAEIEKSRADRLEATPERGPHPMIRLLARVVGVGVETAEMLVTEVMTRDLRDRRAVFAQEDDRRAGEKASDRALATGDSRCDPTRRCAAAGRLSQPTGWHVAP